MKQIAVYAVCIMEVALEKAKNLSDVDSNQKNTVEPTPEPIDNWEMEIPMSGGALKSAMAGCTPGYNSMDSLADHMLLKMRMEKAKIMS
jgi:hypothetical protein